MEVLFITHKYPPSVGGMETQSFHLIEEIGRKTKVHTIIHSASESKFRFFQKLRSRVREKIKQNPGITHVHLNDALLATMCYLLAVDFGGRKVLATFHGLDVVFPLGIYQNKIFKRMTCILDRVICVSNATAEECRKRSVEDAKLAVILNGVDQSIISLPENSHNNEYTKDKQILMLGRPVRRKGFSWFAEHVFPLLNEEITLIHIGFIDEKSSKWVEKWMPKKWVDNLDLFFGRSSDSQSLIQIQKKYPSRMILAGKVSDSERNSIIRNVSMIVMPNIPVVGDMEGFGLVALEAALQGKLVLVSDLEGLKDAIVDGKNGFRLPPLDAHRWAETIHRYLKEDPLESADIRNFTLHNFSWEKMGNSYYKEFKQL